MTDKFAEWIEARVRQARRGHWEGTDEVAPCFVCGTERELNILLRCRDCAFVEKVRTIAIHAEPWALREVRRLHGINGESSPSDREQKYRRGTIENVKDL